jgi:4a-hydroxytetrahydrobiopterin dehydratase
MPKKLSTEEIVQLLKALPEWKLDTSANPVQISSTYIFKDFKEALNFTNRVGKVAEELHHHPAIQLTWGKVEVAVYTHSEGGVTELDISLAKELDMIEADLKKSTHPLIVIAQIKARKGFEEIAKMELEKLVPPTLKEEGCITYELHTSLKDADEFMFYEIWESKEHLDAHAQSNHIQEFRSKRNTFLEYAPEVTLWYEEKLTDE